MAEGLNLTPILIPLLALLVGWAIGFFDSNMRTSKKIKLAEDSAQGAIKEAEDKIAEAQAKLASIPDGPVAMDDSGLMRIKNENGRLTLELDGVRVNTSAITIDQRKRLVEMLNAMRPWLEGKPASTPIHRTPPPQPLPSADDRQGTPAIVIAPPRNDMQPQASASKPSSSTKKKDVESEAAPTSIVGQINAILQTRILNTPLETKGVSLMESSTGGVNVYVGIQRYEAIDDVPDEEIRATIRAAIAEWENKYTPGL